MPLFKIAKVLLIHIPKTGGSSIEDYFISMYQKRCTINTLLDRTGELNINGHSPQHFTFQEIYNKKDYLDLNLDELKIIAAVRNPYHRIISDLFFYKILKFEDTPEITEK
jgi:hypothetical protein